MKFAIYCDHVEDDGMRPYWFVIKIKPSELDWSRDCLNIPIQAPFQSLMAEEFGDCVGMSVLLDDLVIDPDRPQHFVLSLSSMRSRLETAGQDPWNIEQLIIQMSDLEEVLQMDAKRYYAWR